MGKKQRTLVRPSLSRDLIIHPDLEGVRAFHLKAYEAQLQLLSKAKEKIRHYVEVDQAAFTHWWQQEFSKELLVHMGLEEKYGHLQNTFFAVNQYKLAMQCSYSKAYAAVSAADAEGTLDQLMQTLYENLRKEAEAKEAAASKRPTRRRIQEQKAQLEEEFYEKVEGPKSPTEDRTESYIKKIYRDIVRLLHPDAQGGGEPSAENKELWQALQNAYQWRDLDRIERIYERVKGQAARLSTFSELPLADIIAMKESLAEKYKDLTREIRVYKKEANWNFEKRRKEAGFIRRLSVAIEIELQEDIEELRLEIERLKKQLKSWSKSSSGPREKAYTAKA